MGVGKSSLPSRADPTKKPVPKKAVIEAVSRISQGFAREGEWRHREGGQNQIKDRRALAAEFVGDGTEEQITGEHAAQIEHHQKSREIEQAEIASAARDGQGQISGDPSEQAPPGEHAENVHEQQAQQVGHRRAPKFSVLASAVTGACLRIAAIISGSGTPFWIQKVTKAGSTPTKKTQRQARTRKNEISH